ncbi:MAG TPA: hypothetical protein VFB62_06960 [Polyangiaceae bacterium]|jgi:hypothetical protein|nr:hypothetical protein [Polyangiaceae bacterium]
MDYNPYAAPTVDDRHLTPGAPGAGAPQPWEVGEVLGLGWEAVKRDWPVLVFGPFLALFIGNIPGTIFGMVVQLGLVEQFSATYWLIELPVMLLGMAIQSFFMVGMLRMFCTAARGGEPEFGVLFGGADRFVSMFFTSLLLFLIVWVGFALLIVPGVILACGLWLATFYAADGRGPIESLSMSWQATRGHKGQMFLLALASFGVLLLGMAACCVGFFVSLPVTYVATAIVYLRLSGQATAQLPVGPAGFGPPPGRPPGF